MISEETTSYVMILVKICWKSSFTNKLNQVMITWVTFLDIFKS